MRERDIVFMNRALELARLAYEAGEIPVGAVVVKDGEIIAEGYNLRQTDKLATAHAEILAIEAACSKLGGWRLSGCTLYVTLEPCPMCAGAIINSRIDRVVYGIEDAKAGCLGSVINFNSYPFNHAFEVERGVCADECAAILREFFAQRR
ncbi:MAG: tRNA adenosine(34) deaminase TadA [Clostridia bacterium]|nr:tRNA adenosine(34) deaminase TadA [Clostridia bacterium]